MVQNQLSGFEFESTACPDGTTVICTIYNTILGKKVCPVIEKYVKHI